MLSLTDIERQMARLGYKTNLPVTELRNGSVMIGPLMVVLDTDYMDRERVLLIETLPETDGDAVAMIHFRVVYPSPVSDPDVLPEVLRSMLILNRVLPIGHNGFCEDTPGLYFAYTLTVPGGAPIPDTVLEECVGLIDYCSNWHGMLLDQVARSEITSAGVLTDLAEREIEPRPLFFREAAA
ncbi:MAG: hypothetical protein MI806_21970 [Minwuiales bacterium]|nr:hypothetical protein [Minwuiales bacterium]